MPASTTALIENAGYLGALSTDTVANLAGINGTPIGTQLGLGVNLPNIDAATPLIMMPTVAIVTHAPTMFQNFPYFNETLKALIETHAREINGIDLEYNMEDAATPAGHDGQEMHMPTNSKRVAVNPTITLPEVSGNLVWNFIKTWMWMMKSPDTQASILSAVETGTMSPQLFSYFSMDILFIQFDQTMRPENIIDGWFCCNMWPTGTGPFGAKRVIGQSEMPERQIPFHGILQHNPNTKAVAKIIAQGLALHTVNYNFSQPIAQSVDSSLAQMGIEQQALQDLQNYTDLTAGQ